MDKIESWFPPKKPIRSIIALPLLLISLLLGIISEIAYFIADILNRVDVWFWNDIVFRIRWGK